MAPFLPYADNTFMLEVEWSAEKKLLSQEGPAPSSALQESHTSLTSPLHNPEQCSKIK